MKRKIQVLLIVIIVILGCKPKKKEIINRKKKLSYELRLENSLRNYERALNEDRIDEQISSLKTVSYCYIKLKKYKRAINYANRIIPLIDKDFESYSFAYYHIGLGYRFLKQNDSAYLYYRKSNEFNLKLKDSLKIVKRFFNLASIESEYELYFKSDSSAIEGLKYSKNILKFNKTKSSIYNCLGINSRNQGFYNDAIKNYDLAIMTTNDSLKKIRYMANKAVVYKHDKQYDKAILIYENLVNNKFFNKIDLKLKFKILDNFTYTKYLEGQKIDEDDFFKTLRLKDSIKDYDGVITNYSYLSDFYTKENSQRALFYAKKMYSLSKEKKKTHDRIEAIDRLIKLIDGKELRKYALERSFLKDSIIDERKKSRNKLVKVIYNFNLLEKQKLKAQIDVEQQKSQKQLWFLLGLASFLGFITYVFYKRNKTKKEKIIEVYKTETRLAKKIHDELANDMYLAMNKLQKQERKDDSILYDLEKIYSLTRNISHENSPVITGELFEDFLKQLFVNFTTDTCKIMHKGLSDIQVNTLQKEKQIVLYRLLQELLVNMKKHSKANLVVIVFSMVKDTIQVKYKDNGIGTNTLDIKNGLQNMETRIKSVGGTIIFESENEKGFQTKFQFKK